MNTRYAHIRLVLVACLVVGLTIATAIAQPNTGASGGDILAGAVSPWRNAHFVLYAYGAVWGGLALYVWRLASLARRLGRDIDRLEATLDAKPKSDEQS